MKRIGAAYSEQEWNGSIAAQLNFIKKELRYPISRRKAWPVLLFAGMFPLGVIVIYSAFFLKPTSHYPMRWPLLLLIAAFIVPPIVTAIRYLKTLRFVSVPAQPSTGENILLLQRFLQANHFAFSRHPEAPEVYHIISKNISLTSDEREVVVFIADDGRILVNSHFTRSRLNAPIGSPRYKEIARQLSGWLAAYARNNPGNAVQVR